MRVIGLELGLETLQAFPIGLDSKKRGGSREEIG